MDLIQQKVGKSKSYVAWLPLNEKKNLIGTKF